MNIQIQLVQIQLKTQNMDFHIEEQEASRLKQILFPKKTAHNFNKTTQSSFLVGKENTSMMNHSYNIKNQIDRLKKGIQVFMEKQTDIVLVGDQFLSTPRQCLELIKQMSENMHNYTDQIQEAIYTFLESFPKVPIKLPIKNNNTTKYFFQMLKYNYLESLLHFKKRRIYGQVFDILRKNDRELKEAQNNSKRQKYNMKKYTSRYLQIKLGSAFNIWRRNCLEAKKIQYQEQVSDEVHLKINKLVSLLSQEGMLILWLQEQIYNYADATEILIYNANAGTVRSYAYSSDNLTSVFETIQNQSQAEEQEAALKKIKRIQFTLEHSLTKICIFKKQILRINDLKLDVDYKKIDDMTSTHGHSARESLRNCIFTPLISPQNPLNCVGIIRQYYYHQTTNQQQQISESQLRQIAFNIENGVKLSQIFQNSKQKSQTVRDKVYIKGITLMNILKNPENDLQTISKNFLPQFQQKFGFQQINEYKYKIKREDSALKNKATVIQLKSSISGKFTQAEENNQIITALQKMHKSNTSYIYDDNILMIKTDESAYRLKCPNNNTFNSITMQILCTLLAQKDRTIHIKSKMKELQAQAKMSQLEHQKQQQIARDKIEIKQFCMKSKINYVEQIQQFVNKFMQKYGDTKYQIVLRKQKQINECDRVLLSSQQSIELAILATKDQLQKIPTYLIQPLKILTDELLKKLSQPDSPIVNYSSTDLRNIFLSTYNFSTSPQENIKKLLANCFQIDKISVNKQQTHHNQHNQQENIFYHQFSNNPFEQQYYACYMTNNLLKQPQNNKSNHIVKQIRKYSIFGTSQSIISRPKQTIICLEGQVFFIMNGFHQFGSVQQISNINQIYKELKQEQLKRKNFKDKEEIKIRAIRLFIGVSKCYQKQLKIGFDSIKIKATSYYIRKSLGFNFKAQKIDKMMISYAFQKLKITKHKKIKLFDVQKFVYRAQKAYLHLSGVSLFFDKAKQLKSFQNNIKTFVNTLDHLLSNKKLSAFNKIYIKYRTHIPNNFTMLQQLYSKQLQEAFNKILKTSWSFNPILIQTQCSKISKMNKLTQLSNYLITNYPQYIIYLQFSDDSGLKFHNQHKVQFIANCNQIKNDEIQNLIFPCKRNGCNLKNIIWSIPQSQHINLTDKHYLKIISKSMEETYLKSMHNFTVLFLGLNRFVKDKQQCYMKDGFRVLSKNLLKSVKNQEYHSRQLYYEYNIQIENIQMICEQRQKIKAQREEQVSNLKSQIQHWNNKMTNCRKDIVRLDICTKKMQKQATIQKNIRDERQMQRVFRIWRKNNQQSSKIELSHKIVEKRNKFIVTEIFRILQSKQKMHILDSFTLLKLKAICQTKKLKKLEEKIMNQKQKDSLSFKNTVNAQENRLMTFQDDLETQSQCSELKRNSNISIIPVSFKHFSPSKKQNIEVSEEQMRRVNNGIYKLNSKTIKFLKRMGKIGPNESS